MDEAARKGRLRWRCRRGMKELDQVLLVYLDRRWQDAGEDERQAFEALLEVEDDRLWRWMLGLEPPTPPELARLLEQILALSASAADR